MVGSGIACAIPEGWCGAIYPRSGMGCKGLVLKNTVGTIDSHYRGEIKLPLFNNNQLIDGIEWDPFSPYLAWSSGETIHVHKGDRVAQMRIELVPDTTLVEVDELDSTDRGEGSFGSSGVSGERL